ncbi:DMT family transporter [Thermococcus atlanticus]
MKKGYILVFLAASMWGSLGIFAKLLYGFNLSSFTIVFYRVFLALLLLLPYNLFRGGFTIGRRRLKFYALYGFFSIFLFYTLYFYTVKISSVSLAVLLLYTAPIYSTLMGYYLFKEPITEKKALALGMVITGVLLVVDLSGSRVTPLAVALGLLTGVTYALYGILAKFAVRTERPEEALFYTLAFGMLFLVPFTNFKVPLESVPYLFALAFFPTFLGYIFYNHALREVEVSRASIVATVEPVVALILAFLIFRETLTPRQLIGAALIIGGSVIIHAAESREIEIMEELH